MRKIRYFALGALLSISFGVAAQQFGIPRFVQDLTVRGTLTADVSGLTGTLDDARLSSNVPLKNASNVFTQNGASNPAIKLEAVAPALALSTTTGGIDEGRWVWRANGDQLQLRTSTDSGSLADTPFRVLRSGSSASEIELNATTLDFNGDADISGSLAVGGSNVLTQADEGSGNGLDADTVDGSHASDFFPASEVTKGTFTINWVTGCDTTPSQTVNYEKIGNIVHLWTNSDFSCTADIATFQSDQDIPTNLRPASTWESSGGHFAIFDTNGISAAQCVTVSTTGRISIRNIRTSTDLNCLGSFAASGTRSVGSWSLTYSLNN